LVGPATSFEELDLRPEVLAVLTGMGIEAPTPIQSQAIPALLEGRDVIGQARTGSGKTLAFGIPIIERCDPSLRGVQALILTPTRELAIQVAGVLSQVATARRLWVTLLYGGRPLPPEREELLNGAQIVVGTPGRVLDHLWNGNLPTQDLRILVLDEGDEMLDQGFAPDIERILSMMPQQRQTALFSATVPQWVTKMATSHLNEPVTVRVDVENGAPPEIEQVVYEMHPDVKFGALCTLLDLRSEDPILVFGRTKIGVERLSRDLKRRGYPVAALQGNMDQSARERIMAGFRSGAVPILVATNVAARGLDVSGIEAVINYELPESAEMFTHRAGRTGRMGREGVAITFLTPEDAYKFRQIERTLSRQLPRQPWPGSEASQPSSESAHGPSRPRPAVAAARERAPRRGYHGQRHASQAIG
jgi:ATP-dependent RNA helicase DeaD